MTPRKPGKEKAEPTDSASQSEPFVFADYLSMMAQDPRREIILIAYYFRTKRLKFSSKAEVQVAIKRHLRAAKEVAAFEDKRIRAAFEECKKMERDDGIKFTMET